MSTTTAVTSVAIKSVLGNMTFTDIVKITDNHIPSDVFILLLWLTMLMMGIAFLYWTFKRPSYDPQTDIFVEIKNQKESVILSWGSLPHVPGNYRIKKLFPPLGNVTIRGLKMTFNPRIRFVEKETNFQYVPLKTRYISWWNARKIRRIIGQNYYLGIIVSNPARTVSQVVRMQIIRNVLRVNTSTMGIPGDRPPPTAPESDLYAQTAQPSAPATAAAIDNLSTATIIDPTTVRFDQNRAAQHIRLAGVGRGRGLVYRSVDNN